MALSWLDRLLGRSSARGEKAAALPVFAPLPWWRPASWAAPSFDRLAREGYRANAAVFGCLSALAFSYPEAPLEVIDADGAALPDHPLAQLLRRPNALMSEAELKLITIVYKAIGGVCYWHKVRDNRGVVRELWPYHIGQMRPVPSPTAWVSAYEYNDGATWHPVPAEDVVAIKWPSVDPLMPWLPLPPLVAVAREVDSDNEMSRYLYALLINDATPRTVIRLPPGISLTEPQYNRLKEQWSARHGGQNRGNAAILEGGADIDRVSLNLEEMAWEALRRVPEARIAAAFRVPAVVAGLNVGLERATYSNFSEARRLFTEDTLVPMWRLDAGEIEQDLSAEFGGGLRVRHDTRGIVALQENTDAVFARAIDAWDGGLATRNEARRMIGLPPVENIAADLPPGDAFNDASPRPAALAQRQAIRPIATKAGVSRRVERRLAQEIEQYLAGQYETAASGVEAQANGD